MNKVMTPQIWSVKWQLTTKETFHRVHIIKFREKSCGMNFSLLLEITIKAVIMSTLATRRWSRCIRPRLNDGGTHALKLRTGTFSHVCKTERRTEVSHPLKGRLNKCNCCSKHSKRNHTDECNQRHLSTWLNMNLKLLSSLKLH